MPPITDISQLDPNKRYTYADYLTWQFSEWVELIRGKVRLMSPALDAAGYHAQHRVSYRAILAW